MIRSGIEGRNQVMPVATHSGVVCMLAREERESARLVIAAFDLLKLGP